MQTIDITDDIYRAIAARLREEIATAEWYNGTLTGEIATPAPDSESTAAPTLEWRLVLTAIVYRRDEILPEGPRRPVADVVPVWWEFHTTDASGAPLPNDFSFTELKPFLTDYE